MNSIAKRIATLFVLATLVLFGCVPIPSSNKPDTLTKIEGHIHEGMYTSPGGLFRVSVPEMRNPFVKNPSVIRDEWRPDGGVEVNFSVPDLGEAWRFGARPLPPGSPAETAVLAEISDQELARWLNTPGRPNAILEEKVQLVDGPGLARIYHQESASLLFVRRGSADGGLTDAMRESALIGVVTAISKERNRALYAVGQFDMPNRGGHYTLETEKGRTILAAEHLRRMRELTASLRLQ